MTDRRRRARTVLRPYYLVRPPQWRERELRIIDTRSMISRRHGYVYLRIPKAANTTVLRALLAHFPEDGLSPVDIDQAKTDATHFRDLGFRDLPRLRRLFIFTVARNPYARLLSAYRDKFRAGDKHRAAYGERVAAHDGGTLSFRGFCRYLAAGGEAENTHWMRQTRLLGIAGRLDYIGRMETLASDLPTILARIGPATPAPMSARLPGSLPRLTEYYDAECTSLIESVYHPDFARLEYSTALAAAPSL